MAKDVQMFYIESDIKKIQTKTNLYIQKYGPAGAFHLAREIIQNNIDECIDPESNGSSIYITYDKMTDMLTCEDNGRGFPEKDYPLDIFCTKNQSGSKFFRDQGGDSAGEFGVGLTVVNALSDKFTIVNYREEEGYKHTIVFEDGEKIKDEKTSLKKSDPQHGSKISFIPSKKYLGGNTSIPYKDMIDWIEKMLFFVRKKKIKIKVDVFKGMKLKESYTFKPKPFDELLDKIASTDNYSPKCNFSGDDVMKETVRKSILDDETGKVITKNVVIKKNIHVDVALRYVPETITYYDSYCNYTNTIDGGIHQDTFEKCFCNYMQNKTKATMTETQRDKTPILWDDIRSGLCCVINLSTNAQVGFVGNAKTKIGSDTLVPYLSAIFSREIENFFDKNQTCLNEFIKIIKLNAKARVEANKVKSAVKKERVNSFDEHVMKNFIRCNNTGKKFKELFLVEGNSASGSARNGCDPDTQAFFLFRGVVANSFKCSLAEIMQNRELHDLVTVMRCGIGPTFDMKKLYFDRINIFTDADIDGAYISSGMLAFFYKYYRPLIESGKIYKVFSPLYALDDKDHPYVANKAEMVELYHKKLAKNYKIRIKGEKKFMNKDELYDFLMDTYDYRENLIRVAKDMGNVNKFLIESIIAYLVLMDIVKSSDDYEDLNEVFASQKFIKVFMSNLQLRFKEITLEDGSVINGIVDGRFCSINVSNRFIRKNNGIIPVISNYGYILEVQEKDKPIREMTIGEFLDDAMKYSLKIKTRFKGLGELSGKQLKSTTLDMDNRVSVQFTVEDFERELGIMNMIHGPGKVDLEKRKELMKHYQIKRDDLDN